MRAAKDLGHLGDLGDLGDLADGTFPSSNTGISFRRNDHQPVELALGQAVQGQLRAFFQRRRLRLTSLGAGVKISSSGDCTIGKNDHVLNGGSNGLGIYSYWYQL